MALDVEAIRAKLAALGHRDWPQEWGPAQAGDDFLGWSHRYQLDEPLEPPALDRFETEHGITLPADYRIFLAQLGNGGAGPGYGIWPLGEGEDGPLPEEMLANLSQTFAHTEAWNDTSLALPGEGGEFIPHEDYYAYSVIAGSLEIATDGCALYYLLVVSGPARGQIWYDKRTEGEGIEPLRDESGAILHFGEWYKSWLASI